MEKGRTGIEGIVTYLQFRVPAPHAGSLFHHRDFKTPVGENHGRRQTSGTCSNNNDFLWAAHGRLIGRLVTLFTLTLFHHKKE